MIGRPMAATSCRSSSDASPHESTGDHVQASDSWCDLGTGSEGRRLIAESALFGEEENLLAVGRAVWVVVDRHVQLGKT